MQATPENQEIEKAKAWFLQANSEIDRLIEQVTGGSGEEAKNLAQGLPASSMSKNPEQLDSLLRFLITLVLHEQKMTPEDYQNQGMMDQSATAKAKKSLLELLKNDESLRQSLFPSTPMRENDRN